MDKFIANYDSFQCDCENSKFTNPHHKHVITGDLSLVGNDLLRNLIQQCPNFREQPQILSQKLILKGLKRDIKQGVINWARYENIPIEAFGE